MDFAGLQDPMSGNSVPDGWKLMRLGDLGQVRYGLGQPPEQSSNGVPMVRATNVKRGRLVPEGLIRIKREAIPESRNPYLLVGDIIVVRSGAYTGDVAMVTQEWAGSVAGYDLVFSCKEHVDPAYCAAVLLSNPIQSFFRGERDRSAQPHLNRQQLESTAIPVPPMAEQRKIAAVLGLVQRAIEQQERLIALTTELKKALLHKLFTEGLRGEVQKQTEIGPVPESWEIAPLGSLAKVGNGSTPKRDNAGYWQGGTIPWLNSTKIHERFITEADKFVTDLAFKECHLPRVKPSSLLIAITGQGKTLGNSALVSFETCINQHLAYAQFSTAKVLPEFVLWFMQTRYEHLRSISQAGGSTKGALTCGYLKTYHIPVPSLEEQREIADVFAALDRKQKVHERKHAGLTDLFRSLLHQLMTAQIRVHDIDMPINPHSQ